MSSSNTPAPRHLQVVSNNDDDEIEHPAFVATSSWPDACDIEPRQWLYDRHYLVGSVSATVADGELGKTTLVLTEAVAMATGRNLLGVAPVMPLRVLYWNGEESRSEIIRRVTAICQHYGVGSKAELTDTLFIASGDEYPITIASTGRDGIVPGDLTALRETIRELDIDVLVIDPFVACHRVSENDNGAIDFVVKQLARIASSNFIAVELVHHSRKPPHGGSPEVGAADARGASSFIDAVRSARTLNRMTEAEAAQAKVDDHRFYMRVDTGKANYAPPGTAARWFRKASVLLPNGGKFIEADNIGVVEPWRYPGLFDDVTTAHLTRVRLMASSGSYRADPQSVDWIGRAVAEVMELDADDDRAKIKAILRTWFKNGALVTVERKDKKGMVRLFVEPGNQ